jgi:hypothetical protein
MSQFVTTFVVVEINVLFFFIPPISTKQTNISNLESQNTKIDHYILCFRARQKSKLVQDTM